MAAPWSTWRWPAQAACGRREASRARTRSAGDTVRSSVRLDVNVAVPSISTRPSSWTHSACKRPSASAATTAVEGAASLQACGAWPVPWVYCHTVTVAVVDGSVQMRWVASPATSNGRSAAARSGEVTATVTGAHEGAWAIRTSASPGESSALGRRCTQATTGLPWRSMAIVGWRCSPGPDGRQSGAAGEKRSPSSAATGAAA